MKRTTFFKSLLVAAGLGVGANAWGGTVVYDFAAAYTAGEALTFNTESSWTIYAMYTSSGSRTAGKITSNVRAITTNTSNLPINSTMASYYGTSMVELVEGGLRIKWDGPLAFSSTIFAKDKKVIIDYTGDGFEYYFYEWSNGQGFKGTIDGTVLSFDNSTKTGDVIPSGKTIVSTYLNGNAVLFAKTGTVISRITIKDKETIGVPTISAVKSLEGTKHTVSFTPASATGSEGTSASIYYTLNGDTPTQTESATCFKYDGTPFDVDYDCTVKAAAFLDDYSTSSSVAIQSLVVGVIKSATNSYTVNSSDTYNLFTQIQCPDITLELWGNAARSVTDYYFKYTSGAWETYDNSENETETYACSVTKYNTDAPTASDITGADTPSEGEIAKVTVTVSDSWKTAYSSYGTKPLVVTGNLNGIRDGYKPTGGTVYKFTPTKSGWLNMMCDQFNGSNVVIRVWVSGERYYANSSSTGDYSRHMVYSLYLTAGQSYYFSNNNNSYKSSMSSFEFVPDVSVELGTNGYATFASSYPLDLTTANLPTGLTAYKAAVDGTTVTFTPLNQTVPVNTGILLQGDASETYNIPVAASGTAVEGNAFLVNEGGTTFTADDNYYYFGLIKNTLTFGLFDPNEVVIPADKAYLKVLKSSIDGAGSRSLTVVFGDDAVGISQIENGKLKMEDCFYNLNGQRIAQPAKGLYIVNGKKVIIK